MRPLIPVGMAFIKIWKKKPKLLAALKTVARQEEKQLHVFITGITRYVILKVLRKNPCQVECLCKTTINPIFDSTYQVRLETRSNRFWLPIILPNTQRNSP